MDQENGSHCSAGGSVGDLLVDQPARVARDGLSLSERRKLLVEWNQTEKAYPRGACLHQLFEAQVRQSPEADAVESEGVRVSYEQLNARANQLAHRLRTLGVGPETLAGVCLQPSPDLLVALLAILKAGGAYVPLDPTYPRDRLHYMIRDSGMKVLIAERDSRLSETIEIVSPREVAATSEEACANLSVGVQTENLAYVIYTSGSTGQPKGVMVPHRGLVNYLTWAAEAYRVGEGAGALVHSSISFDLTITALFAPLLAGRCVYLLPADGNLESLARALHDSVQFSLVKITPAHLELLCAQMSGAAAAAATRSFIIGGEALYGTTLESWQKCVSEANLVNEYGPTETVVGCCAYFLPKGRQFGGAVPIGRPIANTQLFVLDAQMQPVGIGATGELFIAGDGVARGYLNQPELTAQKFVANPFAGEVEHTSPTMYRTGDLVRYLEDGNLEFLGRIDDQIKIRSHRIEPAEIESALLAHPSIRGAVVTDHTNRLGDKYLVAYLVAEAINAPAPAELRAHLKRTLPEYMVPKVFTALEALPLTANGKVDRTALLPPSGSSDLAADYVAPETEVEQRLAKILGDTLQERIGLHDNFFDLGGHSLLAMRAVAQINSAFATDLDPLTFYQRPTVHELANLMSSRTAPSDGARFITTRQAIRGTKVIFLNPPLQFVRLVNLTHDDASFYISEVPFSKEVVEAALRFQTDRFPTLAEMVAPHVALILGSGLQGSISLAGYSSYGTLAFEVAHQLRRAGMNLDDVYLFDADMKAPRWEKAKVLARRHTRRIKEEGLPYILEKTRGRFLRREEQKEAIAAARAPDASLSNGYISWRVFQRVWDHALRKYQPQPLAAHGVLFRAQTSIYGDVHDYDGCLGWHGLFDRGLEIIEVPGDHVSMWREPDVLALTRFWELRLQRFRETANTVLCSAPSVLAAIVCSL